MVPFLFLSYGEEPLAVCFANSKSLRQQSYLSLHKLHPQTVVLSPAGGANKKHIASRCAFCYPSRRLGISSRARVYLIAEGALLLRLDDIQHFVSMIYNSFGIDDIHACGVIFMCYFFFMLILITFYVIIYLIGGI